MVKRNLLVAHLAITILFGCTFVEPAQANPAKTEPNQYSSQPCDGEYMIMYDAKKHPETMAQMLQTIKQKTSYRCSYSEGKGNTPDEKISFIRVETALPIMIMADHDNAVLDEMREFAQDKNLNASDVKFLSTCNALLTITGAGSANQKKLPNGNLSASPSKYAPHAKDTTEVVKVLMKAVDGIAKCRCSTDVSWIHK